MTIFVYGKLEIECNFDAFANPAIEAGLLHCRALLEFLGLCDRNSVLSNIEKRRRGDVGIEHFKNAAGHLKMVDPQAALKCYDGGLAEAEKALLCIFHLANKGLTTAFVVTYVRLHKGENGSGGFSRDALPEELRGIHDQIIELRNKRFAHNDDHHSVSNAIEIEVHNDRFQIKFGLMLGYHIGGATEWHELVRFLDAMIAEKLYNLLAKLKEKTGRDWVLATGPAPD
jgi:hypothetical protein